MTLTKADRRKIRRLYDAGNSAERVSLMCLIQLSVVYRVLRGDGGVMRGRGRPLDIGGSGPLEDHRKAVLRIRAGGAALQEIADKYGVSRQAVSQALKRWKRRL